MQPRGNLVADPICRTAEIGLTIIGTADAGTFTIIDAPPRSLSRGTAPTAPNPGNCVITLSADWLICRSWGFPPACTFVPPRFTCTNQQCPRTIFQTSLNCANDGAKLTHRVTGWIL